jgi:hypothetical protein
MGKKQRRRSRVHEISRFAASQQWGRSKEEEAEVAGIMRELTSVIGSTSQSLLMGVAAACSATSKVSSKSLGFLSSIKKRMTTSSEKLKDLEGCIDMLESKVDRMYRSLVYCVFELYLCT